MTVRTTTIAVAPPERPLPEVPAKPTSHRTNGLTGSVWAYRAPHLTMIANPAYGDTWPLGVVASRDNLLVDGE